MEKFRSALRLLALSAATLGTLLAWGNGFAGELSSKFGNCREFLRSAIDEFNSRTDHGLHCWTPGDPPLRVDAESGRFKPAPWANQVMKNGKSIPRIVQVCSSKRLGSKDTITLEYGVDKYGRARELDLSLNRLTSSSDQSRESEKHKQVRKRQIKLGTTSDGKCYVESDAVENTYDGDDFGAERSNLFNMDSCVRFINLKKSHVERDDSRYANLALDFMDSEERDRVVRAEKDLPYNLSESEAKALNGAYELLQDKCEREYKTFVNIKLNGSDGAAGHPSASSK